MGARDQFKEVKEVGNQTFFLVEPGLTLEVNVTSFFRIATGLSWPITSGIDYIGYSDCDFSNPTATVNFKFGAF